jgi:hypothetical protein
MHSLLQPARALVDPLDGVGAAVQARRWVWPLLGLCAAMIFSGVAFALRWDAGPPTVARLAEAGELARTTERELEEAVRQAWRLALVGGVAKGLFLAPLWVLLLSVGLKVCCWLVGRPLAFVRAFTVTAVGLLPVALCHLLFGAVALSSDGLTLEQAAGLIPSHAGALFPELSPELGRLARAMDLFNLWSAVLVGLGLAAGTGMSRPRGVLFGLFLYAAFAGVLVIGLPAMGGNP